MAVAVLCVRHLVLEGVGYLVKEGESLFEFGDLFVRELVLRHSA